MPAENITSQTSASSAEPRRPSTDMKFMGLQQQKRGSTDANMRKESINEQYASSGVIGRAWDKFSRGVGGN